MLLYGVAVSSARDASYSSQILDLGHYDSAEQGGIPVYTQREGEKRGKLRWSRPWREAEFEGEEGDRLRNRMGGG